MSKPRHVLVPTDFSEAANAAKAYATVLADSVRGNPPRSPRDTRSTRNGLERGRGISAATARAHGARRAGTARKRADTRGTGQVPNAGLGGHGFTGRLHHRVCGEEPHRFDCDGHAGTWNAGANVGWERDAGRLESRVLSCRLRSAASTGLKRGRRVFRRSGGGSRVADRRPADRTALWLIIATSACRSRHRFAH
jgi:hypothetical protein